MRNVATPKRTSDGQGGSSAAASAAESSNSSVEVSQLGWRAAFAPRKASTTKGSGLEEGSLSMSVRSMSAGLEELSSNVGKFLGDLGKSSGDLMNAVLKPSELKKMREEAHARERSRRGGDRDLKDGGLAVLSEIRQLKVQLDEQKAADFKAERRAEKLERAKQQKMLREVLDEILTTEANYLADLRYTTQKLMTPLVAELDAKVHSDLFANLGQIEMMHAKLEGELEEARKKDAGVVLVGERLLKGFMRLLPFFKMYSTYCASYTDVAKALGAARAVKAARDLMGQAELPLEALLFRPVQRMCVYPLLFKQALKYAEEGEQQEQFTTAFDKVQEIISQVNDDVRRQQEQARGAEILLSEVGGEAAALLTAARTLAMEVTLEMKASSGTSTFIDPAWHMRSQYRWYLFSDMIMVCVKNKLRNGYHKKMIIPLDEVSCGTLRLTSQSFSPASSTPRAYEQADMRGPAASMPIRRTKDDSYHAPPPPPPGPPPPLTPRHPSDGAEGALEGSVEISGSATAADLTNSSRAASITADEKPEVFFLRHATKEQALKAEKDKKKEAGILYKCWAADAAERARIVEKIHQLQQAASEKAESRERAQTHK